MQPFTPGPTDFAAIDQPVSPPPDDRVDARQVHLVTEGNLHFDKGPDGLPVGTPYCPACLAKECLVHTLVNPTNECVFVCPTCHAVTVNFLLAEELPAYARVLKRPK